MSAEVRDLIAAVETGRLEERKAIVAWLRGKRLWATDYLGYIAVEIERGAHLAHPEATDG